MLDCSFGLTKAQLSLSNFLITIKKKQKKKHNQNKFNENNTILQTVMHAFL